MNLRLAAWLAVFLTIPLIASATDPQAVGQSCSPNGITSSPNLSGQPVICTSGVWALTGGLWGVNGSSYYYNTGAVGIGTTSPAVSLDLSQETDGISLPKAAAAAGSSCTITGELRFNTTIGNVETCNGSAWLPFNQFTWLAMEKGPSSVTPCAIQSSGTLWCWGGNGNGQVGVGNITTPQTLPLQVGSSTWAAVAEGASATFGIQTNGTLWDWGTGASTTPTQIGSATWTAISASGNPNQMACGIQTGGTLWCWGSTNVSGQLGQGNTTVFSSPTQVGSSTWTAISAGGTQSSNMSVCGIQTGGTLWCWGANGSGQLGQGTTGGTYFSPTQVGSATWTAISQVGNFACGIQTGGTLWCWGLNTNGQLGQGNTTSPLTSPTQVGSATWTGVTGSTSTACGIQTGGTLWCWGFNTSGQLGQGNTTSPLTSPTQVGSAMWTAVTILNGTTTCAIQSSGTLWCWGGNGSGQVGVGNITTPQTSPLQVL
jgi:alpha-tubulin suppressor-like RCC1 family protein